ncbi:MAG: hypothetical protein VX938_10430, partial [Myxococcota bacterium]|nr:hypothetical protein [Myxococcota bacterium]
VDDSSVSLETLDAVVLSRVESLLDTTTSLYDKKLAPMVNSVMRYSSHIFNLASSVKLSGDFSRKIRTVADYEFDLSNAAAREALNRAISGRAVILGAAQAIGPAGFGEGSFADLTLADAIAKEDLGSADPRIRRLALVSGDQREKHHAVTLYGLWMSTGMEWTNKQNTVRTTNSDGFTTTWLARAWEKKHKSSWIGGSQSETFGSGGYTEAQSAELLDGSYWFTWRRQFPNFTANPVADALSETLNLLGPIAIQVGVPAMYDGEYDGQVSADLSVLFPKSVLEAIFDPSLTPDELLWEVLGETAETFDNKHGLPYLVSPLTPEGAKNTPGGAEACGKVASAFGGYYCWYFQDTFLPALRAAQDTDDPEARLAFFEMFYKTGWFANPVGSRLLVRYISGLAYALDVADATSVRIVLTNAQDDSISASPELEAGDPMDMALLEAVDPSLFVDL